ncbi:peptidylprolyl isomerase, partial [Saccharophagus degradans]|nr:peptidylprolyl isomerase [Saccharophagus degradans]
MAILLFCSATLCYADDTKQGNPTLVLLTYLGVIVFDLFPKKAPITVDNFLVYFDSGFYDGTIFHRVIPGFFFQGGGLT